MKTKQILTITLAIFLAGCSGSSTAATSSAGSEKEEEQQAASNEMKTLTFNLPSLKGGLSSLELQETKELSDEEKAEADKAMRAYSPTSGTPLINNAKSFYYYDNIDEEEKKIYDAMLLVAEDPVDPNNIVVYSTELDPSSDEFTEKLYVAYYAMQYDHPELFWMYNEINAEMMFGVSRFDSAASKYHDVYFYFNEPYETFKEDVEAFNKATAAFLADIDLNGTEAEIALNIHDKLIETVTYDTYIMDNNIREDLAHTAYGALVANSRGDANTAVCDGYSLAYEYLCQQAGLEVTVVLGDAGASTTDMGGHAWSMVKVDGKWYEVDSTWDDMGTLENMLEDYKTEDIYPYYKEALDDEAYRSSIEHYLFEVPTDTMDYFQPTDEYFYYSKDGMYRYSLVDEGIHVRASENEYWYPISALIELSPVAE